MGIRIILFFVISGALMLSRSVGDEMEQKKQVAGAPLQLEVNLTVEEGQLLLVYKLKNTRSKPIYLFNILWDWDKKGDYVAAKAPVYSCLRQDGLFHLAKQILPLPRRRVVEARRIPFATKVDAGGEFSEKLQLPLPVEEYNPYFPAVDKSRYEVREAIGAIFTLQFIEEVQQLKITDTPLPPAVMLWHPNLFGHVEAVESKPKRIKIKVKKRLDEFEEF
ncbi:MAG TPA: hypothetical protein VF074_09060 [Pyrinomonadaceae bacterium]